MTVSTFRDLPLADRSRRWNSAAAEKRVRTWAGAEDGPNARYRQAHLWYDANEKDNFTAHKLPIADVIDGELTVVPRAVIAAAGIVDGARGGVDVPDADLPKLRRHLARYYKKMDETPPWQ
ncbi:hypothetical protein GIS00_11765 [Nakamurella sp. YIM 132087]|uniref:Uncharacterized protein n=1 Tax=Nakamurella alba TaxID=2665158 RepID=A0A7K1FMS3_9ACTN|nr:hypothetical protein [Nakamurella alba]MTD14619.1 hypothetical protein [Nakamurella alba]